MAASTWSTLQASARSGGGQVQEHCLPPLPTLVVGTHHTPHNQVLGGVGVDTSSLLGPGPGAHCHCHCCRWLAPVVHLTSRCSQAWGGYCVVQQLLSVHGTVFLFLLWWGGIAQHCGHLQSTIQAEAHRHGKSAGCPWEVLGVVVVIPGLAGFAGLLA